MRIVWMLSLCCFMFGCAQQFILGIPDQIAASAGVGLTEVGQLMTAFGLANAIGTPVLLALGGRTSQRNLMAVGLGFMAAGMFGMSSTSDYALLLVSRAVMGLGNGAFVSNATAISATLAKPGHEASAIANVSLGFSASQVLAMPFARTVSPFLDWHWFYAGLVTLAVIALVAILRLLPNTAPMGAGQGFAERLAPLKDRTIALALSVTLFNNIGYAAFYTYITPYLTEVFGGEGHTVSAVLLAMGFATVVGAKGSGLLADRIGYRKTIVAALGAQVLTLTAVGILRLTPAMAAIAVVICLWSVSDWSFMPSQNLLLTKLAPAAPSMAIALSGSALQLGNALGAATGGAVILAAPLTALPFVAAASIAICLVIELFVLRRAPATNVGRARGRERNGKREAKEE